MRVVLSKKIEELTRDLAVQANTVIRADILTKLKEALRKEKKTLPKTALEQIIENAEIAKKEKLAICQDTGLPVVFAELGQEVLLKGSVLDVAVNKGIKTAYEKSGFRRSVIQNPLRHELNSRQAGKDILFTPAVIHVEIKAGRKIKLTVVPKGFGSENVSRIKMFNPTAEEKEIVDFVVDTVRSAGPAACPPFIIGIGIGGTLDKAVILSKKALCLDITKSSSFPRLAVLEKNILKKINAINLGPMGFGGSTTALSVRILTNPTHIAGLPVAVSIGCHATRSATGVI